MRVTTPPDSATAGWVPLAVAACAFASAGSLTAASWTAAISEFIPAVYHNILDFTARVLATLGVGQPLGLTSTISSHARDHEISAELSILIPDERSVFRRALIRAPPPNQTGIANSLRFKYFWRRKKWLGKGLCTGRQDLHLLDTTNLSRRTWTTSPVDNHGRP